MNVLGHEISDQTIDAALRWFPPERSFTFNDFQLALTRCGCPREVSDRAADRILQKARKAGTHVYSGGRWKRAKVRAL
ncbi:MULTISPECIES: hypothetical protein [unclassified Mesorhizobium]|uniref:hypothetical protein n=1 Tax=unclassified Mesorhizobium TaxID=325217 RepID=UPI000FCB53E0|nr:MULTISPECIES: hypothetical protein [unclassified Mesorhizobium]TGP29077.1 hypothetical protein EN875_030150 [Mesorhizobium sp. M2D.F.Ca.ET.232.01.1.1]TGQ24605.1 hypothetical protein EN863_061335 [Mesorhizobium sp. M00.F.Ca.ET.220.01.1.1]TGU12202.1 hypothetical protein EN806_17395 [bacterium M00.F.Ca.ET.163.01.1.1]